MSLKECEIKKIETFVKSNDSFKNTSERCLDSFAMNCGWTEQMLFNLTMSH